MTMPGFSADIALYGPRGSYRGRSASAGSATSLGVSPQLPISIGFCMAGCDDIYGWGSWGNIICKFDCLDRGRVFASVGRGLA